jgi:catechol 2,3-dioxygenase-like lactoylglutathione lyase family enzyme
MFDHISIGVRDLARSRRFYDATLGALGYDCLSVDDSSLGYGKGAVGLWIGAAAAPVPPDPGSNLHFCFTAPTRASVDAFHAAALAAGGSDNGPPACVRPMVRVIMPHSSSIPTVTGWRPIADRRGRRNCDDRGERSDPTPLIDCYLVCRRLFHR